MKSGDVLLRFNGEAITDQADLRLREAATPPGDKVEVAGLRAGVPFEATLELAQRPVMSN